MASPQRGRGRDQRLGCGRVATTLEIAEEGGALAVPHVVAAVDVRQDPSERPSCAVRRQQGERRPVPEERVLAAVKHASEIAIEWRDPGAICAVDAPAREGYPGVQVRTGRRGPHAHRHGAPLAPELGAGTT